jgi:hypothetical protein
MHAFDVGEKEKSHRADNVLARRAVKAFLP